MTMCAPAIAVSTTTIMTGTTGIIETIGPIATAITGTVTTATTPTGTIAIAATTQTIATATTATQTAAITTTTEAAAGANSRFANRSNQRRLRDEGGVLLRRPYENSPQ